LVGSIKIRFGVSSLLYEKKILGSCGIKEEDICFIAKKTCFFYALNIMIKMTNGTKLGVQND
jgi:hypothetical protein